MDKAFITGRPVNTGPDQGIGHRIALLTGIIIFSFGLSCIYMAMRGVMRLGGFVASNGPYQIAHQAPGWVWIFPVSVFLMLGGIFTSVAKSSKLHGPNLMALSWSALFLALGWNFIEFGFGIGTGGELSAGWIVCAVMFVLMGLVPLLIILSSFFGALRERRESGGGSGPGWGMSLLVQGAAAVAGTLLGLSFFRIIAS